MPERRPVLLVAGGATLFDHRDEIDRFHALRERPRPRRRPCACSARSTDAQLEGLYRAADVFALPSVKEGFGLAVLEALAAGLPAVVSDLDVFRTYLADGDSALMAPVGDHAALAAALVRVGRQPEPRRAAARRRARGGGAPRLGRRRGGARGGLRALPGRGGALMALEVVATLARRPRHRRAGARATRSASTSPRRAGGDDTRHDADRAVLRRAGELLLPGRRASPPASATRRCPGLQGHRHRRARRATSCATSTSW